MVNPALNIDKLFHVLNVNKPVTCPGTATCPLCKNYSLEVYDCGNIIYNWLVCKPCGFYGSISELISKVWNIPLKNTILKLKEDALISADTNINNFIKLHNKIARMNKFWASNSNTVLKDFPILAPLNKLHINPRIKSVATYNKTFDNIIRAGNGRDCVKLLVGDYLDILSLTKHTYKKLVSPRHKHSQPTKSRLVMPYYCAPNCVATYSIFDSFEKRTLIPNRLESNPINCKESGISFNSDLLNQVKNKLVIFTPDLKIYLKMAANYYSRATNDVFNFATWFVEDKYKTITSWDMFNSFDKIFWHYTITPALLHAAIQTNAKIFVTPLQNPTIDNFEKYVINRSSESITRIIKEGASSWKHALQEWAKTQPDNVLEFLLLELKQKYNTLDTLLIECDNPLKARLNKLLNKDSIKKLEAYLPNANIHVIDDSSGWHVKSTVPKFITDMRLVITDVIFNPTTSEKFYKGYVIFKNKKLEFFRAATDFNKNALDVMEGIVLSSCIGVPSYSRQYSKYIVDIALKLRPPNISNSTSTVGWDAKTNRYTLSKIIIENDIKLNKFESGTSSYLDNLNKKIEPESLTVSLFEHSNENTAFWMTYLQILTSVICPIFNFPVPLCLFYGNNLIHLGKLFNICGINTTMLLSKKIDNLIKDLERMAWPIAVNFKDKPQINALNELLNETDIRSLFVKTSEQHANTLFINNNNVIISPGDCFNVDILNISQVAALIVSFIQECIKDKNIETAEDARPFVLISNRFISWLEKYNVNTECIKAALNQLIHINDDYNAICRLIFMYIKDNRICTVLEEFATEHNIVRKNNKLYIALANLNKYIERKSHVSLDLRNRLTDRNNKYFNVTDKHIVCDEEWFVSFVKKL